MLNLQVAVNHSVAVKKLKTSRHLAKHTHKLLLHPHMLVISIQRLPRILETQVKLLAVWVVNHLKEARHVGVRRKRVENPDLLPHEIQSRTRRTRGPCDDLLLRQQPLVYCLSKSQDKQQSQSKVVVVVVEKLRSNQTKPNQMQHTGSREEEVRVGSDRGERL